MVTVSWKRTVQWLDAKTGAIHCSKALSRLSLRPSDLHKLVLYHKPVQRRVASVSGETAMQQKRD